jgi:hypothetical protein
MDFGESFGGFRFEESWEAEILENWDSGKLLGPVRINSRLEL